MSQLSQLSHFCIVKCLIDWSCSEIYKCKCIFVLNNLSWKGGLAVHETDRVKFEIKPDSITLKCKSAELKDAGKYSLTLTNEKGTDSISLNVAIVGKLIYVTMFSSYHVCYCCWKKKQSTYSVMYSPLFLFANVPGSTED